MSVFDISQGFSHISPQELINYAERGVLFAGMVDLSGFVEYILSENISSQKEAVERAFEKGCSDGRESVIEETIHYLSNI